jgi:lipopolysaccharide/colanic/teichoic acid biosynthesis glycosyltransferase
VIRVLDAVCAVTLLVVLAPLILVLGLAIKVESRGPVFYRSRRVGLRGREFEMLKFRKMPDGAGGSLLTAPEDERFTRLGQLLARTKLDELPQLWNVIKGQMSLVGPRPEDPEFVRRFRTELEPVLGVKPGITGLSQLAFVREPEILDPNDREGHYMERILPQKIGLDSLYAARRSVRANLRILLWTALALFLRKDVAVHRGTGRLGVRRRPRPGLESLPVEQPAPELELGPVPAVEQSAS